MTDELEDVRAHYRVTGLTDRLKAALSSFEPEKKRFMPVSLPPSINFIREAWPPLSNLLLSPGSALGCPTGDLPHLATLQPAYRPCSPRPQ
jgi:hypothetical protein